MAVNSGESNTRRPDGWFSAEIANDVTRSAWKNEVERGGKHMRVSHVVAVQKKDYTYVISIPIACVSSHMCIICWEPVWGGSQSLGIFDSHDVWIVIAGCVTTPKKKRKKCVDHCTYEL